MYKVTFIGLKRKKTYKNQQTKNTVGICRYICGVPYIPYILLPGSYVPCGKVHQLWEDVFQIVHLKHALCRLVYG